VFKKLPYRATINYLRLNKNYDKVYIFSFGRMSSEAATFQAVLAKKSCVAELDPTPSRCKAAL